MFGRKTNSELDSLIGSATRLHGNVSFAGGLRVDGEVRGSVSGEAGADSLLIVAEHARIVGAVQCHTVVVNGTIEGPVVCTGLLELQPNGRIIGDVHYSTLEMHGGATVTGTLTHQDPGEPVFHLSVAEAAKAVAAGA